MIPTAFDEENTVLDTPKGMTAKDCAPISVWRGVLESKVPVVISCWKITKEELEILNKTGRVWLMVMGDNMTPVHITCNNPFGVGEELHDRT